MGYFDNEGTYHSLRHGLHRAADRILHPIHGGHHHHHHSLRHSSRPEEVVEDIRVTQSTSSSTSSSPSATHTPASSGGSAFMSGYNCPPSRPSGGGSCGSRQQANTIVIPCHHIRIGDLVMLQSRPCQVIRISSSGQTGQHRYLGVDLFTKELHEESSFTSHPAPSVMVQNMLGPVFKQYRVLDVRVPGYVVAMTEMGDVKQNLPVLDQEGMFERLVESFDDGRAAVRVLVVNDGTREMAVDFKAIHGSRL